MRPQIDVQKVADKISDVVAREKARKGNVDWDYASYLDTKYRERLVYDMPERNFLGLRIISFRPNKDRPDGWSLGWHTWNKGVTLSYRTPQLKTIEQIVFAEGDDGSILPHMVRVTEKPSFWQRRFPKHFTFTIAKLGGRWRMTRAYCPFMEAMFENAPLLSKEAWEELGKDHIEIYNKDGTKSGTSC